MTTRILGVFAAAAIGLLVAGCAGTGEPRGRGEREAGSGAGGTQASAPRRGGYYLDDGPGDNPPADLDTIPDAQPRAEPIHRASTRPYTVFGREYVPMPTLAPYRARGTASWYGRRYHGKRTSIGEVYDMYTMTAAHPTLPLPSYVRVTNLANGRAVVVRVNDRGPFLSERIIDLSYAAAYRLGYVNQGSASVEVELLLPGDAAPTFAAAPREASPPPAPREPAGAAGAESMPTVTDRSGVYLQLGAFSAPENAESFRLRVSQTLPWLSPSLAPRGRDGLVRVQLGPYSDAIEAMAVAERIRQSLDVTPHLTDR